MVQKDSYWKHLHVYRHVSAHVYAHINYIRSGIFSLKSDCEIWARQHHIICCHINFEENSIFLRWTDKNERFTQEKNAKLNYCIKINTRPKLNYISDTKAALKGALAAFTVAENPNSSEKNVHSALETKN